jgi:hypothetical protein
MNHSYAGIKIRLIIAANGDYYNLLQEFEISPVDDEVGIILNDEPIASSSLLLRAISS